MNLADQPPLELLAKYRIVPVIALEDATKAVALGDALIAGGLPIAEVTFRTKAAADTLQLLAGRGDLLLIAGTVLTKEQVEEAVDSGARMIVTPGINSVVIEHAMSLGVPVCPGVCTPSDIEMALSLGIHTVKFFPAEAFGGVATIRALGGPYPMMRFMPTGGISKENLQNYLALPSVLACGGSWMVAPKLYAEEDFTPVEQAVREAVQLACVKN